jgi:uncharacterized membrane protein
MNFSKIDKYGLAHDLIKVALFNILVHISMEINYNDSKGLFGQHFLVQLLITLTGFTLFYVLIEPHIKAYFSTKKKQSKKSKKSKKSSSKSSSSSKKASTTPVTTTK